jgi:hypothetical protein
MIRWVRSVLGLENLPVKRTVLGNQSHLDLKAARQFQHSANRLKLLQTLCHQYKGTPHEQKINLVYEKTQSIHTSFLEQQKGTELELFHLQNTDNFINTFALIKATHQKNKAAAPAISSDKPAAANLPTNKSRFNASLPGFNHPVKNILIPSLPPVLQIPAIAIDTFTQVDYVRLGPAGDLSTHQIGITSAYQEKEYFLATVATRVGIYKPDLSYVGNTQVLLPDNPASPPGYLPVINWRGNMYVVNLNDFRLFPVKINRNNG